MKLSVKNDKGEVNQFEFDSGPITIGRRLEASIFLSDTAVSREHAMIVIEDDEWIVKNLSPPNKTFLNGTAIHKAQLGEGDVLKIASFTIAVSDTEIPQFEVSTDEEGPAELEAMLATPRDEVVVRNVDGSHAPAMRLAAKRITEFAVVTEATCDAENMEDLINTLIDITMEQFTASCVWCGIKKPSGREIIYQVGKRTNGAPVELDDITLNERIMMAMKRGRSSVLPQVAPRLEETERIRSALIAGMKNDNGIYGVLYVHNAMKQKHYSLSDLDYLMFIAIQTAAVIKKFL